MVIPFLVQEGAITAAAFTGIFTASMMNSLKANIIEPLTEKFIPTKHLDKNADGSASPINKTTPIIISPSFSMFGKTEPLQQQQSSSKQDSSFHMPNFHINPKIRWQTFLRDFVAWILVMLIFYLVWKHIFHPYKVPPSMPSMGPVTNGVSLGGGMFNVQKFGKRN